MTNNTDDAAAGRGRPSVAIERRAQIVNAFIELVAEQATTSVSLGAVAERAGVARTAIRHFVGNRVDLIEQAVVELAARYRAMIEATVGPEPLPEQLVTMLFHDDWVRARPPEDRAFDLLVLEARSNPDLQPLVGEAFAQLVEVLSAALARAGAPGTTQQLDDAAYAIICISEHNVVLQALGFEASRSQAAKKVAMDIVAASLVGAAVAQP